MIVWLASYPRSGNTYLRIVIHRLFGCSSSTVYPVDGVAERLRGRFAAGADPFERPPASLSELRADPAVHLVKTHRQRHVVEGGAEVLADDPAICLVRDGRDALVSFARQRSEDDPTRYAAELRALLERPSRGTGRWGANVLSWLEPAPNREVLRYDDLIADPIRAVSAAVGRMAPDLVPATDPRLPAFADLHRTDPEFFRRGVTGAHRDELPTELADLFWSYPDNAEAMAVLGLAPGARPA